MENLVLVLVAILIDFAIGEIDYPFHPIRLIGNYIIWFQRIFRKDNQTAKEEKRLGLLLVISLVLIVYAITFSVTYFTFGIVRYIITLYLIYSCISIRCLKDESMKVYYALKEKDITKSRYMLSRIVGRDTNNLNEEEIIKATVETISENTSDGSIAPLLFILIGGAPFGFIYKAINTMDSMVGYKSDKYINFGYCAAKLDDIANYIPARLTGLLIIMSSFILRYDAKNSMKIFLRDRYNHKSPNSAQAESATAGALGILLGGDASYFGDIHKKPTIGDMKRRAQLDDIVSTNKMLYVSSIIFYILAVSVYLTIGLIL